MNMKMCPNPNCPNSKGVINGNFCPECGTPVRELRNKEGGELFLIKRKVRKGKNHDLTPEEVNRYINGETKEEKAQRKQKDKEKEVKSLEKTSFLGCTYKSKQGVISLKREGVLIKLISTNPLSFNKMKGEEFIRYSDMTGVHYEKGFNVTSWPKLYIETATGSKKFGINVADRDALECFVKNLNSNISKVKQVPPINPGITSATKIKEAKELLDMGAITEQQFEEIRDKYLEKI